MAKTRLTRRQFVATSAAASAMMIAAPFVRAAQAAGKSWAEGELEGYMRT